MLGTAGQTPGALSLPPPGTLRGLYAWLDRLPLSRPKRHLARDFSDGVMLAEIVKHFHPRLVDLHNYTPTCNTDQKLSNWHVLNRKVLHKLSFYVSETDIRKVVANRPGAIEPILCALREKIESGAAHIDLRAATPRIYPHHLLTDPHPLLESLPEDHSRRVGRRNVWLFCLTSYFTTFKVCRIRTLWRGHPPAPGGPRHQHTHWPAKIHGSLQQEDHSGWERSREAGPLCLWRVGLCLSNFLPCPICLSNLLPCPHALSPVLAIFFGAPDQWSLSVGTQLAGPGSIQTPGPSSFWRNRNRHWLSCRKWSRFCR
ncbi:uncharacterized protein LOC128582110 isoform X2 [Nycticebus coucang]|uniref:uncharacterized protein LOC128582110 isoform X2 n=1 Tax=Nycticebus coucang TaxID=9470 RepID=UPI00234C91D0|nr:uncharacterized protein LOC128582110 isoform X2 [Nycticebus coucang]